MLDAIDPDAGAALAVAACLLTACASRDITVCDAGAVGSAGLALVGGSGDASYLGLSPEEQSAIVVVGVEGAGGLFEPACSGTIIGTGVVLTAAHCLPAGAARGQLLPAVGLDIAGRSDELQIVPAELSAVHPELDLLTLSFDAGPSLELHALALAEGAPAPGRWVQLAGFGADEGTELAPRSFAVEPVTDLTPDTIVVDGAGLSGACNGDSGGPLLIRDTGGEVAVAGVLSGGSVTCRGLDRYTRVDVARGWLGSSLVEAPGPHSCGALDRVGRCFDGMAVWCDAGERRASPCEDGDSCGWSREAAGFRCLPAAEDLCRASMIAGLATARRLCAAGLELSCVRWR